MSTANPRDFTGLDISPIDGLPLTIDSAARGLRSGRWKSVDLLQLTQERRERLDDTLVVFAANSDESAISAALAADAAFASGIDRGPLQGIPLALKDVIATCDAPTRAQSKILDPDYFGGKDAAAVALLRAAGAVLTGKTVTMEFALGVPDVSAGHLIARNPFDTDRWTGGTSTGMGAGTAAGLFLGGLGSDTAGSVRIPASLCGITGLRPTFGTVSTRGLVPLAWSQDTIGPMARSARDCALILTAITNRRTKTTSWLSDNETNSLEGLRVGFDPELTRSDSCDPDVLALAQSALDVLASLGAQVTEISLPYYDELCTASTVAMCTEALAYHRENLRQRWADYGAGTRASLALGALTTSADYVQAQRVRSFGVQEASRLFRHVDAIASPTTLTHAPLLEGLDLGAILPMITTQYWSSIGAPSVSMPMGLTSLGLPVGLQIAAAPFKDATVLKVAQAFQHHTRHHMMEPPLLREVLSHR